MAAGHDLTDAQQAAIERFARYLAALRRSPNTRRLYVGGVLRWFRAGGQPGHVDSDLLARWLAERRRTVATATVNLDIKALRAFYDAQRDWGACSDRDLQRIPRQRKPPHRTPRWLSDAEVGQVLGSLPIDTFVGLRDYAMILTLYVTGVRASELIAMQLTDVIEDDLLFVDGKAGTHRYVPLGQELAGVLNGYRHARARTRPGRRNAFWVKSNGKPLRNGRSAWEIVSKRVGQAIGTLGQGRRLGNGRPWTGHYPHELRASFATALLHNGCNIIAISELMGHSHLETTALYLGVDMAHLQRTTALHPRARRVGTEDARSVQAFESGSADNPFKNVRRPDDESSLQLLTPTAFKRKR